MGKKNVRFIRVRGRIVPIHEKGLGIGHETFLTGLTIAGIGAIAKSHGQEQLMKLKLFKPRKNPFRAFRVAEKATALSQVNKAMRYIGQGNRLASIGKGIAGAGLAISAVSLGATVINSFKGKKRHGR